MNTAIKTKLFTLQREIIRTLKVTNMGPFIYQKDPKYRKEPEIPERPVNGSTHARVKGGGGGRGSFDFNI